MVPAAASGHACCWFDFQLALQGGGLKLFISSTFVELFSVLLGVSGSDWGEDRRVPGVTVLVR